MISIIVPIYKVEEYLPRCLDSIINQTYKDLEIILVDDGSPDKCGDICDKYAEMDNRIKVIHKKNGGLSSARNTGLEIASGDYIAFVDSDDWIEPNAYELLLDAIESMDADIAIIGYRWTDGVLNQGDIQIGQNRLLNKDNLWDEILTKLNNASWNKLYKAKLLGDTRYPIDLIHGEDLIFNLEYINRCDRGVINDTVVYNYFIRPDSITGSGFSDKKFMEITVKDEVLKMVEDLYPSKRSVAEKFCFRARMNILRSMHKSRQEENYAVEIEKIREYIFRNYKNVSTTLRFKEKIEYILYRYFSPIYKFLIRGR